MYYIHLHGNDGFLYILLPGNTEWTCFDIEYPLDRLLDIKESKAQRILTRELPKELTETFDFDKIWHRIREVYKLF